MKKRILSIVLTLCMLCGMLPTTAWSVVAETTETAEQELLWGYNVIDGGVELTAYLGSQTDIYVPSKLTVNGKEYAVLKLANGIFENNDTVNSVTLAEGIVEIGARAFYDCDALVCVLIGETLTTIGDEAFYGCDVFNSIILYDTVTAIGADAFALCPNLTIWCNEGTAGYHYAVENGVTYEILNPEVTPETVTVDDVIYYIQNGEAIAIDYTGTATEVTIPSTVEGYPVTKIQGAFSGCKNLLRVTLPETIRMIDNNSFNGCKMLVDINIPNGVETIGEYAFAYCKSLTQLDLPDTVVSIGMYAFCNCEKLETVNLSTSLQTIYSYAFYQCYKLKSIVIPDSVSTLETWSFASCSSLQSVVLSSNIKAIRTRAFSYCDALESVTIPEGVSKIDLSVFAECDKLKTVVLPKTIESMDREAFCSSTILLVYPDSYAHTFAVENGLLYFIFDGVNTPIVYTQNDVSYYIQNGEAVAIDYAGTATEVTIPSTVEGYPVTKIQGAFSGCKNLLRVTLPETIRIIDNNSFNGCEMLADINIPNGVETIGEYAFAYCKSLTQLDLPDTVVSIGMYAFRNCEKLETVNLSTSLQTIYSYAFYQCYKLKSIVIPDSVSVLEIYSFASCSSLQSVVLSSNIKTIRTRAFSYCDALESVTIPEGVSKIDLSVFAECDKLKTVVLPKTIKSMDREAFCSSTILLVYPDSYAHTFAQNNDLLYFVIRRSENPDIAYGAPVSGTVTYTDGTAAAGVSVEILYDDGVSKETVIADANGNYDFTYAEVGTYTVRATDDKGHTATTRVSVKRMNVFDVFLAGDTALTMKTGYTVSGTVSDVPATVTLTDKDGNVIDRVETTDGNFTFTDVPNGEYIIIVESENGTASKEITVFDGNVTDTEIVIESDTASLWGYVEIEDREYHYHRRLWVDVTLYNADGVVVAQTRTDDNGAYRFDKLPLGSYTLVAQTTELRYDYKHGYNRHYKLTGYAYVDVTAVGEYQVDTIVLYEENDHRATISGKVTKHGGSQVCEVILHDVFRAEVARYTTKNNGKYIFNNIGDGLYFITAYAQSEGVGFAVVVVRGGKVYGETDIVIYKSDKVKDHEDRFQNDIPDCHSREEAMDHKDRIAEEKRFYDSLSEKEKKQLSKEYLDRLEWFVRLLSGCEYFADDGVTVEQSGLVVSGKELENENTVTFELTVEKTEAWTYGNGGVHTRDEYLYHEVHDAAGDRNVSQYYEITMSKTVDGDTKTITDVYKDTDAKGKFRITMPIPEEYRGHKHYAMVHIHNGETTVLTDLDDNPDTITFEVDRFSTFVLTTTDETLTLESGDVNGDGTVAALDVRELLLATIGATTLDDAQTVCADVNCDDAVNSRDARALLLELATAA